MLQCGWHVQEDCGSTHECASPDVRTTAYTFNNGSQNVQVCEDIRSLLDSHAVISCRHSDLTTHGSARVMHFSALPGRWRRGSAARLQ